VSTISHEAPCAGMGTLNFITEIPEISAVLDKGRKESRIHCFGQRADEQHAVLRAAATV
jgi:hypothetical protein